MRARAALGSAVFFVLAPGGVAGLVPWWLTGWHARSGPWPLRVVGLLLLVAGTAFLVTSFVRFVVEGLGTPAPVAPPKHLVVGGVYRYVRNPMYLAVLACIVGQYLLLFRPVLLVDALVTAAAMVAFVRFYEEPRLAGEFGEEYAAYRRAVPGWWPRLRPDASGTGRPSR
jgi:protein-S-isoprenylcysteine O-methyltransferase Ste14